MIESRLRPWFQQKFVERPATLVSRWITPDQLTLMALLSGLVAAAALSLGWNIMATILIAISGYMDIIDGSVARIRRETSPFGTILDIFCDRVVEIAIIVAFAIREPQLAFLCTMMMGASMLCITSFLVVGIFAVNDGNKSFYYSPGLIERAEAFIFFVVMALLPAWAGTLGIIYIILVMWTALFRIYEFYIQQYQ